MFTMNGSTGAKIVERVAVETSVNPRLLLAVLEDQSGWVLGEPSEPVEKSYPLGLHVSERKVCTRNWP